MTSMRRWSCTLMPQRSKSRRNTLVETLAPAPRQIRAAQHTRPRATCAVMAKAVERTATPASA